MAYQITSLQPDSCACDDATLRDQINALLNVQGPRFRRLWAYYRNPMRPCGVPPEEQGSERPYRQAQEWGLPSRITGLRSGLEIFAASAVDGVARKEVVIENDIAWRIDTIVDYLFGKPIVINSAANDPNRRPLLEALLRRILACNGGIVFLQQLALLSAVYGYVDVLVKFDATQISAEDLGLDTASTPQSSADQTAPSAQSSILPPPCGEAELGLPPMKQSPSEQTLPASDGKPPSESESGAEASSPHVTPAGPESGLDDAAIPGASIYSLEALDRLARRIRLEIVEPARALPLLSPTDYRCVNAYAQVYQLPQVSPPAESVLAAGPSLIERLRARFGGGLLGRARTQEQMLVVEVITPTAWQRYEDQTLVAQGTNSLGCIPLVHIQNSAVPFEYSGMSDVEPLIPVQDEINVRLSDRGYRITMQAFKMYLGKGIENFMQMPVAPGRMWLTDNENADIVEFGGDEETYGEDNHLSDMRDAMDKISCVTPIAAGAIKGKIGNLTSAAALRVTMSSLLAKIERKRTIFGPAIEQLCSFALQWLDRAGLFSTTPDERRIEINWPSPLPDNETEDLQDAQTKLAIGVPRDVVLRELGY